MKKICLLVLLLSLSSCGVKVVPLNNERLQLKGTETIIKTGTEQQVTLNIVDWSDSTKKERIELNQRFMADFPNVLINYTTLTQAQFNETMLSGIRTGNAPDLFPLPSTMSFSTAMAEGWFQPLSNYVDSEVLSGVKSQFFQENITTRGKDVYLLPEVQEIPSTMMFYNKQLLKEVGVTEDNLPNTWEEFVSLTTKISQKGKGQYFGMVTSGAQKNRVDLELRSFSELSGSLLGPVDQLFFKNNRLQFATQEVKEAFAFYEKIYKGKGFHPDSALLSAPEARKVFGEGKAAFIIQGSWCIPVWRDEHPNLDFGVMKLPEKKVNQENFLVRPFSKGWMGISSASQYPDIAGKYLEYLYSYEYQKVLVEKGGFISIRQDLGQENITDYLMQDYYRLAMEQSQPINNPLTNNEHLDRIYANLPQVSPDFADIGTSILSGTEDYVNQLDDYQKRLTTNLLDQIKIHSPMYPISLSDFNYQKE